MMKTANASSVGAAAMVMITAALIATGCASDAPAPTLLTLPTVTAPVPASASASAPAPATPAGEASSVVVVRRLGLPEYLTTRRVRYRTDASTIGEWPNTYWAERVEIGMLREYAAALRQALPGWTVCEASCAQRSPQWAVQVDLVPLDYRRSERRLDAKARVELIAAQGTGAGEPKVVDAREQAFSFTAATDTPQAEVQTFGELVGALARLTADAVKSVAATR